MTPTKDLEETDDPVVQVRLISTSADAFKELVASTPIEFACAGPRVSAEGIVTAHVLMKKSVAEQTSRSKAVRVEIVADLSATTGKRRAEVGKGNRFADAKVLPTGHGVLVRGSK
jgi:hypothetical protein